MNWNYEDKVIEYIANANRDCGLKDENGNDFVFEVCTEQAFLKKQLEPSTIYVVIKYLSTTNTLNAVTQPVQLLVFCEQNQIQASQIIFRKFVESHNFEVIKEPGIYVKQDYREPVVLSNFNEVSYGYRTIMYISGTLYIMEGIIDIDDLAIGVNIISPLTPAEITERNNCFDEGNTTNEISTPFYVTTEKLKNKVVAENVSAIGFYYYGTKDGNTVPLIKVNGYLCHQFVITSTDCILEDDQGTAGEIFNFSQTPSLTFQFLPMGDDPDYWDSIDSGTIGGADYYKVFPDIITDRIYHFSEQVRPIASSLGYSMSPNTQPIPPSKLATSVKSVATFSMSLTVPLTDKYQFIEVVSRIMTGELSGNATFSLTFKLGNTWFTNVGMKLTSVQVMTSINEIPSLQIGLIK